MGIFGRKKEEGVLVAPKGPKMSGWTVECGPTCGFMARNHNKEELGQILKLHMKNSHKTNMTDAESVGGLTATTWGG